MSTPESLSDNDTVNEDYGAGNQIHGASAALGIFDDYDRALVVNAWRDDAAGLVRLQIGLEGDPDRLDAPVSVAHLGTPVSGPSVVSYGGGAFAVQWTEIDSAGVVTLREQRFTYDPEEEEVAAGLATTLGAADEVVSADLDGAGHAVLVASDAGVALRFVDDATGIVSATVSLATGASTGAVSLAATGPGDRVAAAWEDGAGSVSLVVASAAGAAGAPISFAGREPAVARLADGRLALAFETAAGVVVRIYGVDATGALSQAGRGHHHAAPDREPSAQLRPAVVGLSDGTFVVGWTERPADVTDSTVVGQRFTADGALSGEVFRLGDDSSPEGEDGVSLVEIEPGVLQATFETTESDDDDDGTGVSVSSFAVARDVVGTDAGEVIEGTSGDDRIDARGGDDTVRGNGGDDTIFGGAGNDRIEAAYGYNRLFGEAGDDTIIGGEGYNEAELGAGNDLYEGTGSGTDRVTAGEGADTVSTGDGDDTVYLTVDGLADMVDLGYGRDDLVLDLSASTAGETLDASLGTLTLSDGTTVSGGDRFIIQGSGYADVLRGASQGNGSYYGDNLNGGAGDDLVDGGDGDDQVSGGAGIDTVLGGEGDDVLGLTAGEGGDLLDGGGNSDWGIGDTLSINGYGTGAAVVGDLTNADETDLSLAGGLLADGTRVYGIERVNAYLGDAADDLTASSGNDYLYGNGGNDTLRGGDGDDVIAGDLGADVIDGGNGDDRVNVLAGDGADLIEGGAGRDTLALTWWDASTPLALDASGPVITTDEGLVATGFEALEIQASELSDDIRTGATDDVISGRRGDDTIRSGAGNDRVSAGEGSNSVDAGAGDDRVTTYLGGRADAGGRRRGRPPHRRDAAPR